MRLPSPRRCFIRSARGAALFLFIAFALTTATPLNSIGGIHISFFFVCLLLAVRPSRVRLDSSAAVCGRVPFDCGRVVGVGVQRAQRHFANGTCIGIGIGIGGGRGEIGMLVFLECSRRFGARLVAGECRSRRVTAIKQLELLTICIVIFLHCVPAFQ